MYKYIISPFLHYSFNLQGPQSRHTLTQLLYNVLQCDTATVHYYYLKKTTSVATSVPPTAKVLVSWLVDIAFRDLRREQQHQAIPISGSICQPLRRWIVSVSCISVIGQKNLHRLKARIAEMISRKNIQLDVETTSDLRAIMEQEEECILKNILRIRSNKCFGNSKRKRCQKTREACAGTLQ